ncbi:hypothetical protein B4113_2965 [Geobacillus sp. B4113_201601]|nr:hypothetical protein B4113_2965 [Geobacillus sp. B4113_201601]
MQRLGHGRSHPFPPLLPICHIISCLTGEGAPNFQRGVKKFCV